MACAIVTPLLAVVLEACGVTTGLFFALVIVCAFVPWLDSRTERGTESNRSPGPAASNASLPGLATSPCSDSAVVRRDRRDPTRGNPPAMAEP